jgi:hypothetical protein
MKRSGPVYHYLYVGPAVVGRPATGPHYAQVLIAKRDIRDFLSEKRFTIPDRQEEGT